LAVGDMIDFFAEFKHVPRISQGSGPLFTGAGGLRRGNLGGLLPSGPAGLFRNERKGIDFPTMSLLSASSGPPSHRSSPWPQTRRALEATQRHTWPNNTPGIF
jgi:hypothetical protein